MAKKSKKRPPMTFVKSAVLEKDFPVTRLKEIALAGRSNAGKSSLINAWANQKIAKVSQVPGKTRLLNFFQVGENYMLVDMPGYGWASRSIAELETWNEMIENYLKLRDPLVGLVLLIDIARDWTADEAALVRFLHGNNVQLAIGLTKSDRFRKHEIESAIENMKRKARTDNVFALSAQTGEGCDEFEDFIYKNWIKD